MTAVPDLMVTLANGTQVPWTEFREWSYQKQTHSIRGMSQESRAKMLETKKQNPQRHSDETKAKLRQAHVGKPKTLESIEKMRQKKIGKSRSAEACAKTSATLLANPPRVKPIMTPSGVFPRLHDAIAYAKSHGMKNPRNKIMGWLKTHPDQFYFLPRDTK